MHKDWVGALCRIDMTGSRTKHLEIERNINWELWYSADVDFRDPVVLAKTDSLMGS